MSPLSRKETGGTGKGRPPAPSSCWGSRGNLPWWGGTCTERKTLLPAGRRRTCVPAWTPQTASPSSSSSGLAVEDAPQGPPTQDTAETPRVAGSAGREEHVAAGPVAGPQRHLVLFLGQALTLGRCWGSSLGAARGRCCGRRTCRLALAITPGLLLALLPTMTAGPVLLLGTPAPPAAGGLAAGCRAVAALRPAGPEPVVAAFEQAAAAALPGRALQWR